MRRGRGRPPVQEGRDGLRDRTQRPVVDGAEPGRRHGLLSHELREGSAAPQVGRRRAGERVHRHGCPPAGTCGRRRARHLRAAPRRALSKPSLFLIFARLWRRGGGEAPAGPPPRAGRRVTLSRVSFSLYLEVSAVPARVGTLSVESLSHSTPPTRRAAPWKKSESGVGRERVLFYLLRLYCDEQKHANMRKRLGFRERRE